jgi:hypothetical protein
MPQDFKFGELALSTEVCGGLIVGGVRDFHEYQVGSLLPDAFAAYVRLFHPAHLATEDGIREVRWRDVAQANGKLAHPAMEWGSITASWQLTSQPGLWDHEPDTGSLPLAQGQRLAHLLARQTTTNEKCWFAIWKGFASVSDSMLDAPRVQMPQRPMLPFHGPLNGAPDSFHDIWEQSPRLWWPEDRAWCVATDVDLMTTYIGGSTDCIASILAANDLEAMQIPISQGLTWETDTLNGPVRPPS